MGKATTERTCNVPGCGRKVKCRGLCPAHYQALTTGVPARRAEMEQYAGPPRTGPRGGGGKRSSLSRSLATLAESAGRIEAAVDGLVADCNEALDSIRQVADAVNRRNAKLLKSLALSRRQVQALSGVRADKDGDG